MNTFIKYNIVYMFVSGNICNRFYLPVKLYSVTVFLVPDLSFLFISFSPKISQRFLAT